MRAYNMTEEMAENRNVWLMKLKPARYYMEEAYYEKGEKNKCPNKSCRHCTLVTHHG